MEENIISVSENETDVTVVKEESESCVPDKEARAEGDDSTFVDYDEIARADLEELKASFPELSEISSISMIENPLRYAALRDLGLSAKEAYLATNAHRVKYDNRSHLRSSVPKSASAPTGILTRCELEAARELFSGLSDREIQKLYKKVSR